MKTRKWLLAVLCLALAAMFVLSGCNTPAGPTGAPTATPEPMWDYDFPDLPAAGTYDFGGEKFVICSYHAIFEQREDFMRTYALIDQIEKRFNCEIDWVYPTDRQADIDASALVGLPIADIGSGLMCHEIVPRITQGILSPIQQYADKINWTDADKYEQSVTKILNINGIQYGATPKIQELWKYHYIDALFMNKDLLTASGVNPDDLYAAQENKTWTWDMFAEVAGKVTRDINHDDVPDVYGCQLTGSDWVTAFMVSAQTNVIHTDENGYMYFQADDKVYDVLQFFYDLTVSGAARPLETASSSMYNDFVNGTMGFYMDIFQRTWTFLLPMTDEYGVLCPPLAEGQTEYYLNDSMYRGMFIYAHADKEKEAKVADLLSLYCTKLFIDDEDETACYWSEANNRISDEGSRYFLERVFERTNIVMTRNMEVMYHNIPFNINEVLNGVKTPKQLIEEVTPQCQNWLAEYYNMQA